jgi:catalase
MSIKVMRQHARWQEPRRSPRQCRSNANKSREFGEAAREPAPGAHVEPRDAAITGSTLTESNPSPKLGSGVPPVGFNATIGPLDRVRADAGGQVLTTNQGVPVADNQSSLKAGLRGPALLEDFILREKITHFDHERIPERIVHARGSAAHGYFECYEPLTKLTRASVFAEANKRTPVFVRFSTVAGERGSADTVRDVRGFAVKFYTDEGNWDLVGNNMPVFFIQDAMKFPDLIHSVKPEPHHGMPQAASAHDTFWDFVSLMPESVHMQMWAMSDRAIPRSYRMMQGFGVHTFRMVNERGVSVFVKFHWNPVAGTHSLDWDEAVQTMRSGPRFSPPRFVGSHRSRCVSGMGTGSSSLHRGRSRQVQFRRARRHEDRARGTGAGPPRGPHGAQSQSRQFLRRDRAGRILHRAHRAGPRFLQRSAAGRPHPFLRRHADLAARRA